MKKRLLVAFVFTILTLIIIAAGVVIRLATPEEWPIQAGTLKADKVNIGNQQFIMVEGQPMNYLGQIQSINIELDDTHSRFVVSRYLIHWNPLSKVVVNNQWPVVYPLDGIKSGKYTVVYKSTEGETTAGTFDVSE
jgi:hypothetical protein